MKTNRFPTCALPLLAGLLGSLHATPAAAANLYDHLGKGPFGSLSWVTQGYGYYHLHGGEYQIQSSQTNGFQNGSIDMHGTASSSLWDGKLHAMSFVSRCNGPNPGSCAGYDNDYISAGTAFWERLQIGEGPDMGNIPIKLRVAGSNEGVAAGFIRYYVGTHSNPVGLLNSRMDAGYIPLPFGSDYETVDLDLSTFYIGKNSPINIYVELMTNVRAHTGGVSLANYGNTASFSWELPEGVTITSSSGQFLAAPPVPEPATWALMAAGVGALGWLQRRRTLYAVPV